MTHAPDNRWAFLARSSRLLRGVGAAPGAAVQQVHPPGCAVTIDAKLGRAVVVVAERCGVVGGGRVVWLARKVGNLAFKLCAEIVGQCPLAGNEVGAAADGFRSVLGAQRPGVKFFVIRRVGLGPLCIAQGLSTSAHTIDEQ